MRPGRQSAGYMYVYDSGWGRGAHYGFGSLVKPRELSSKGHNHGVSLVSGIPCVWLRALKRTIEKALKEQHREVMRAESLVDRWMLEGTCTCSDM